MDGYHVIYFEVATSNSFRDIPSKVIATVVIMPLEDPTRFAQSMIVDLRPLCLGYVGIRMSSFGSPPMYSY